ncbi:MAG: LacI family transcriptional regulator [Propionibacteriaceae bacterium]|jgi:LacI family transcriptional regulator|nr:LacI family transcriptional regulator [Propionibacteriaceae bacterium]
MKAAATDRPRKRGSRGPTPAGDVSLRDVAAQAGVSPATVSRVFSGNASVQDETRRKVLKAADELGYVVNGLAKAMLGTAPRILVLIASELNCPEFTELAAGAEQVAHDNGSCLALALTHGDPAVEQAIIERMRQRRPVGVLLATAGTNPYNITAMRAYAEALKAVGATLVLCGQTPMADAPDLHCVGVDRAEITRALVHHLYEGGHRRIALLGAGDHAAGRQSLAGYKQGLNELGLAFDANLARAVRDDVESGQLEALLARSRPNPPSAFICRSDQIALGVYRVARDSRLSIPDQFAIAGFGDSFFGREVDPALTTVRVPYAQVGEQAATIALQRLDDQDTDAPSSVAIAGEIIPRPSTRAEAVRF